MGCMCVCGGGRLQWSLSWPTPGHSLSTQNSNAAPNHNRPSDRETNQGLRWSWSAAIRVVASQSADSVLLSPVLPGHWRCQSTHSNPGRSLPLDPQHLSGSITKGSLGRWIPGPTPQIRRDEEQLRAVGSAKFEHIVGIDLCRVRDALLLVPSWPPYCSMVLRSDGWGMVILVTGMSSAWFVVSSILVWKCHRRFSVGNDLTLSYFVLGFRSKPFLLIY